MSAWPNCVPCVHWVHRVLSGIPIAFVNGVQRDPHRFQFSDARSRMAFSRLSVSSLVVLEAIGRMVDQTLGIGWR